MYNVSDKLGSAIKSSRLERHLTQKQLANRLSISTHYLMSIENKRQMPSSDLLFRIIRELELSANAIFYPEIECNNPLLEKLHVLLGKCDEQDIIIIIAMLQSLLQTKNPTGGE